MVSDQTFRQTSSNAATLKERCHSGDTRVQTHCIEQPKASYSCQVLPTPKETVTRGFAILSELYTRVMDAYEKG